MTRQPNGHKLQLWCITMINRATRWFEMAQINQKDAYTRADVVQSTWFMQYPWPMTVIIERGTEFLEDFAEMIQKAFGETKKFITTRNLKANLIIECTHQTIRDMIYSFELNI